MLPALLLAAACSTRESLPDSAGVWRGTLEPPAPPMLVTVELRAAGGGHAGTVYVPDDRILKPLEGFVLGPERVAFSFPTVDGDVGYEGVPSDDAWTGTFGRGDRRAPLVLRRVQASPDAQPYDEVEVPLASGSRAFTARLFRPRGAASAPAVVLVHGTAMPGLDDQRFFADLFARRGIAALAYDKRSTCGEYGWRSCVDLRDLAADAAAGWNALRGRPDVDPQRIGFFGFSEGGWVAPLAAEQVEEPAFVVNASGPCVSYAELNRHINATTLRRAGFGEDEVDELLTALERVDRYVRTRAGGPELAELLAALSSRPWFSITNLGARLPSDEEIATLLRWRCLDLDPSPAWERIRCPVLAVYGEADEIVPVAESAARLGAALERGANEDHEVRVVPGANHSLQPGCAAFDAIVEWVARRAL